MRSIVFAARKEGKIGTAFGRYGDSPERNGIPAKQFAVVADDPEELEETLSRYEPTEVDVTINVDDTMCKGVESWAWYGLQPINQLTKPNGTLIVTSRQEADDLVTDMHQKDSPFGLSVVKSTVSFSGLWVYKDDHTDVRILGTLCSVCPDLFSLESMTEAIRDQWNSDTKVASAQKAYGHDYRETGGAGRGQPGDALQFRPPRLEVHGRGSGDPRHRSGDRLPRRRGRLPARAELRLQEVQHPLHAPGHQLRHLHQVHPLLAPVPGYLLRRNPRRPV